MKVNYINVSGRTLSLTGGRMLPPFAEVEIAEADYDYKLVKRGFLQDAPKPKAKKPSQSDDKKKVSAS